jgi:hypothetical protein
MFAVQKRYKWGADHVEQGTTLYIPQELW